MAKLTRPITLLNKSTYSQAPIATSQYGMKTGPVSQWPSGLIVFFSDFYISWRTVNYKNNTFKLSKLSTAWKISNFAQGRFQTIRNFRPIMILSLSIHLMQCGKVRLAYASFLFLDGTLSTLRGRNISSTWNSLLIAHFGSLSIELPVKLPQAVALTFQPRKVKTLQVCVYIAGIPWILFISKKTEGVYLCVYGKQPSVHKQTHESSTFFALDRQWECVCVCILDQWWFFVNLTTIVV